jgi:hypothetical protein
MSTVKLHDDIVGMRKISGLFPRVFFHLKSSPFHEVDQLVTDVHAVLDYLDFILVVFCDVLCQDVAPSPAVAVLVWLEEQHMESTMDPAHRLVRIQVISLQSDPIAYCK